MLSIYLFSDMEKAIQVGSVTQLLVIMETISKHVEGNAECQKAYGKAGVCNILTNAISQNITTPQVRIYNIIYIYIYIYIYIRCCFILIYITYKTMFYFFSNK